MELCVPARHGGIVNLEHIVLRASDRDELFGQFMGDLLWTAGEQDELRHVVLNTSHRDGWQSKRERADFATFLPRLTSQSRARIVQRFMSIELTRNFCIIAHIDHGKTTLSDRLLERTGTIQDRERQDQLLDSMDLERERGITIKAHPVAMRYTAKSGQEYRLNLLDTPGHVDFAYEVSRSLAACEGALLIVDAAQGVEAQTVANVHLAHKQGLTIVPVINKIDLPNADIPAVHRQIEEILQIPAEEAIDCSAKMGIGIEEILEAVIHRIPPPVKPADGTLRALVFDSVFDVYRGVVAYVRVMSGSMVADQQVRMMNNDSRYEIKEVGVFTPKMFVQEKLSAGDIGYFIANIKTTADI